MTYWPGTNTPKSAANAFSYDPRPSVMWSETEERRAKQLVRKVDAKKAAEKVTQFHPHHSHNFKDGS